MTCRCHVPQSDLFALIGARRLAIGRIRERGTDRGIGTLVRSGGVFHLLTALHVVAKDGTPNEEERVPRLRGGLVVEFAAVLADDGGRPAQFSVDKIVEFSSQCADQRVDWAVVSLVAGANQRASLGSLPAWGLSAADGATFRFCTESTFEPSTACNVTLITDTESVAFCVGADGDKFRTLVHAGNVGGIGGMSGAPLVNSMAELVGVYTGPSNGNSAGWLFRFTGGTRHDAALVLDSDTRLCGLYCATNANAARSATTERYRLCSFVGGAMAFQELRSLAEANAAWDRVPVGPPRLMAEHKNGHWWCARAHVTISVLVENWQNGKQDDVIRALIGNALAGLCVHRGPAKALDSHVHLDADGYIVDLADAVAKIEGRIRDLLNSNEAVEFTKQRKAACTWQPQWKQGQTLAIDRGPLQRRTPAPIPVDHLPYIGGESYGSARQLPNVSPCLRESVISDLEPHFKRIAQVLRKSLTVTNGEVDTTHLAKFLGDLASTPMLIQKRSGGMAVLVVALDYLLPREPTKTVWDWLYPSMLEHTARQSASTYRFLAVSGPEHAGLIKFDATA